MSEFKLYVYDKITNTIISGYNGIDITGNSYTITGLTDNTEYTIKMRRYDENGNLSNISKTKNVITDNATIPNILVTNENFARFEVYFDSITNASGYLVYLSKNGEPVDNYNPYFSDTNDFAITGLIPESTYSFYVVTAYGGKTSQPSDSYIAVTEAVNLDNPSNLVISNVNYRNSTITWDSVLDATHYDVYIENVALTGMNAYWDTISLTGETSFPASITGSTSFTFDNGVPQQPFRYYVKAKYYEYESDYVQSASGSFSIVPDVTALEETNVSTSGFTVNWTKVLDIGSVNQSGYYVYLYNSSNVLQNTIVLTNQDGSLNNSFMSGSSGFVTLTSGMVSPTGMNETMYILNSSGGYETNLVILDNTTYKYKVKAHYNYNASANFSNEISVTTDELITTVNYIYFNKSVSSKQQIIRANIDGSNLTAISNPANINANNGYNDDNPIVSPDGQYIAFTREYNPNGQLCYMKADGTLFPDTAKDKIIKSEASYHNWSLGCWRDNDEILYTKLATSFASYHVHQINKSGASDTQISDANYTAGASISPDGLKIVYQNNSIGGNVNALVVQTLSDNTTVNILTDNECEVPFWAYNDKIYFCELVGGLTQIFRIDNNGANKTRIVTSIYNDREPKVSPITNKLFFIRNIAGTKYIYRTELDGSDPTQIIQADNFCIYEG